jgi:hypothetical protein
MTPAQEKRHSQLANKAMALDRKVEKERLNNQAAQSPPFRDGVKRS